MKVLYCHIFHKITLYNSNGKIEKDTKDVSVLFALFFNLLYWSFLEKKFIIDYRLSQVTIIKYLVKMDLETCTHICWTNRAVDMRYTWSMVVTTDSPALINNGHEK